MSRTTLPDWPLQPPANWTRIATLDMHAGGEPLRVTPWSTRRR